MCRAKLKETLIILLENIVNTQESRYTLSHIIRQDKHGQIHTMGIFRYLESKYTMDI